MLSPSVRLSVLSIFVLHYLCNSFYLGFFFSCSHTHFRLLEGNYSFFSKRAENGRYSLRTVEKKLFRRLLFEHVALVGASANAQLYRLVNYVRNWGF
jgi:hypothetical protein